MCIDLVVAVTSQISYEMVVDSSFTLHIITVVKIGNAKLVYWLFLLSHVSDFFFLET